MSGTYSPAQDQPTGPQLPHHAKVKPHSLTFGRMPSLMPNLLL